MIDLKQKYKNEKRGYNFIDIENPNGTRTAEFHTGHIHYKSGTEFKPINANLVKTGSIYQVKDASYSCIVPEYADDWFTFTNLFGTGSADSIRMKPIGAQHVLGSKLDDYTVWYENAMGSGISLKTTSNNQTFKKEFVLGSKLNYADVNLSFEVAGSITSFSSDGISYTIDDLKSLTKFGDLKLIANKETLIKQPIISDSGEEPKSQNIKFAIDLDNKKLKLTKVLPKEFLSGATYPVYTDDTTSYFSIATGDGSVKMSSGLSWDTIHNETNGIQISTGSFIQILTGSGATTYICRAFFPFDTSGLSANAIFVSGVIGIHPYIIIDIDNDGNDFIAVVGSTTQAGTGSLILSDYSKCGSTHNPVLCTGSIDIGTMASGTAALFVLNASGLSIINKTGISYFGMREGHDINDHPVSDGAGIYCWGSEKANTKDDPYLTVYYTTGGAPPAITSYPMTISLGTMV